MPAPAASSLVKATAEITINLGYCRLLIDYLSRQGYDVSATLALMQIKAAELSDWDFRIPRPAFLAAFEAALLQSGDADIGLHAGEQVLPNHFGVLGLIAIGCENGRQLLEYRARWHQLVANGETWEQRVEDQTLRLIRSATTTGFIDSRLSIDCGMAAQIMLVRWLSGRDFTPRCLCFPYPQPANLREYQRIFRCELRFDAPALEMQLPIEFLQMPLLQGNPELLRTMIARAERLAASLGIDEAPLLGELRRLIAQRITGQMPEIGEAAASLGLSARQLQSRLANAGTHYKKVLDETRKQLALAYIEDRNNSLTDVAFLLGFSEQSAFNHAFKRWTECTPSDYRKKL